MSGNTDGPVYHKFNVTRVDGTHVQGEKHHGCDYFVLDVTHDKFARPALLAYAQACEQSMPELSASILKKIRSSECTDCQGWGHPGGCPECSIRSMGG